MPHNAHDLDRYIASLELALPRYSEAARIYREINRVASADEVAQTIIKFERNLRLALAEREAAARS